VRRIKRWRYYCDFCNRSGGRTLAAHELHCTMNPNRVCRLCAFLEEEQAPIATLARALYTGGLNACRVAAHNCPACILAAIRQLSCERGPFLYEMDEFDFKKEMAQVFDEARATAHEREMHRELYG